MVTLAVAALLIIRKPARQSTLVTLLCTEATLVAVATMITAIADDPPTAFWFNWVIGLGLDRSGRLHVVGPDRGAQGAEGRLNRPPETAAPGPGRADREDSPSPPREWPFTSSTILSGRTKSRDGRVPPPAHAATPPRAREARDAARHTAGAPSEEGSWASGSSG